MDNRTRLNFHGERRIWDGGLIKQKIKGNSALYIYTDEVLQLICRCIVVRGLMGACGQPGYVFRDFCFKQGIDFIFFFVLNRVSILSIFVSIRVSFLGRQTAWAYVIRIKLHRVWFRVKCLKQGIKNGNSVLNRV